MPAPWTITTTGAAAEKSRPPVAAKTALPSTWSSIDFLALLGGPKGLAQILDDVGGGFEPDGEPHQILADPGGLQLLGAHLGMGRAARMDHEGLGIADIGQ